MLLETNKKKSRLRSYLKINFLIAFVFIVLSFKSFNSVAQESDSAISENLNEFDIFAIDESDLELNVDLPPEASLESITEKKQTVDVSVLNNLEMSRPRAEEHDDSKKFFRERSDRSLCKTCDFSHFLVTTKHTFILN